MPVKRIDHIAIVVESIEKAQGFYEQSLGLPVTHIEQVDAQEVIVAFLPAGDSEIELVEPISEDSGIARFLQKNGPGIHHIALEVDDLEGTLSDLKSQGIRLINEKPAIGSGGKRMAFIHPRSTHGVLIELYETSPEEPQRRTAILNSLKTRFTTERKALKAGLAAFASVLRAEKNNGEITLKAEGEMLDEE